MSDHGHAAGNVDTAPVTGHEDPMSHVPPGSPWPFLIGLALILIPFGTLALLGHLHFTGEDVIGLLSFHWNWTPSTGGGRFTLIVGGLLFLLFLMGWANQIIREKVISHDLNAQQRDLKFFTACFLTGEFAVFGAIFGYFYHRQIWDGESFGPPHGMHFGGPTAAYATFLLIFSSVTCELAHRMVEHHKLGWARFLLVTTILLGITFLGFQGYEYGELVARGFHTGHLSEGGPSAFASIFYASTGFHGVHVAIGLVMLFMVLLRLELGHFTGSRHFSMVAASWYWHFVDIVWVLLFITVYVVS